MARESALGSAMLETARMFAFPRFPGTSGERRAADLLAAHFEEAGLDVRREPFETSLTALARLRLIIHGACALAALAMGFLAHASPLAGAILGVGVLAEIARLGRWPRRLEGAFDRGPMISSENVTGRRPGKGARPARVVFLAHFDSKSARWPAFVPVLLLLLGILVVLGMTIWLAFSGAGHAPAPHGALPLAGGAAAAAAFLAGARNPSGNRSPGAMDNASGISVLVELARRLPADPTLAEVELLFLGTGAEEIGLAGAARWIRAHAGELGRERTVFVNVDSVGVGRGLFALDTHGASPGGRRMASVVSSAGRAARVPVRPLAALPGVGVDTMPIGARRFATVTLLGRVLGAPARRIHSTRDTMEHLEEQALRDAFALAREIGREALRPS